ncbi:MAG: TonB family protein [Desulfatiglandaceae bacterium]
MDALWNETPLYRSNENHWGKMFLASVIFHVALFSLVFLIPEAMPTRRLQGTIYEVSLVEAPARKTSKAGVSVVSKKGKPVKRVSKVKPAKPVKLLERQTTKEKPVVIAKRVVKKRPVKSAKLRKSPSKLIDQAVSRIEKKVENREADPLNQAIARIESRVKSESGQAGPSGGPQTGIAIQIYKVEVETVIKGNWAYPAAFMDPGKWKNLAAVVIIRVSRDGSILDSRFEKRSGNAGFDESVQKAIERSNPLPPFPEGYMKTYDEIEINFNLRELKEN